ncbi:hypothetical protein CRYUN_Cryun38cG0020500 [Craigia yunnanensis]
MLSSRRRGISNKLSHALAQDYRHSKVPHRLQQVNQTAYEPELVSIGPCHRHKEHLRQMEGIKMQYFDRVFNKKGEETKNKCFEAISKMEKEVRDWYDAYVDGVELYGLITQSDGTDLATKAFAKLIEILPVSRIETENPSTINDTNKIDHLLGLVHDNWIPSPQGIDRHKEFMDLGTRKPMERQSIGCAKELEEAGIEFIKVDSNEKTFLDVNFTDGKMKIPTFVIGDDTERLFRNLIAYELFVQGSTNVIDYVSLMDNLVNTANDVQLLRSCGVIENMLGDDEVVAKMLNKLRDYVTLCGDTFFYEEIFVNVQKHCKRPWNTWKAKLRHDYFSNPWAPISFLAALVAFLITVISFTLSFF